MCRGHSTETEQQTPEVWSQASWPSSINRRTDFWSCPSGPVTDHQKLMSPSREKGLVREDLISGKGYSEAVSANVKIENVFSCCCEREVLILECRSGAGWQSRDLQAVGCHLKRAGHVPPYSDVLAVCW